MITQKRYADIAVNRASKFLHLNFFTVFSFVIFVVKLPVYFGSGLPESAFTEHHASNRRRIVLRKLPGSANAV
jgi:hypothetical protein